MFKRFFAGIFFCMTASAVFSQKIDSLKNALPTSYDSAAVNSLNGLSFQYILGKKKIQLNCM